MTKNVHGFKTISYTQKIQLSVLYVQNIIAKKIIIIIIKKIMEIVEYGRKSPYQE